MVRSSPSNGQQSRRLRDIQLQLDQRKQMLQHLPQDYPQIHH